jgi:indolepyruvate ferredoxin oxidoreductase beta subunit
MPESLNFLFVGVGGQGILTASDIVAEVGLAVGYDAKKSEIHGFSQRGGVVDSHVRWGEQVAAPVASRGEVDFLISFEFMETVRWLDYLKPGGVVLADRHKIMPMSATVGDAVYPADEEIEAALRSRTDDLTFVEGVSIAGRLGTMRMANIVLLGALSARLPIDPQVWLSVIERRVPPKYVELNRAAFWEGRGKTNIK